jgi:hypothetical protein
MAAFHAERSSYPGYRLLIVVDIYDFVLEKKIREESSQSNEV